MEIDTPEMLVRNAMFNPDETRILVLVFADDTSALNGAPLGRVYDASSGREMFALPSGDRTASSEAKRLTRLLEDWTPPLGDLCLYYPSRRNPSAALKAFVGLAREVGKRKRV